ncbi:hypothetical protein [Mesorhizobium sp. M4B.F.Ca.ET.058.02.1.1]|uniref:hypothetical protein n=1 Tax=Mesorhizobium sp. M4B.F.Ca.ET.058.02.1.1 TaxID=2493675 RepID=UPI000F75EE5B|nr:hypothetical protein [Mesorhizobium sp. M4B.F.Ca.ET.058.02.1.1]AZO48032.1 hypothetical protein EJ073_09530 [Mesorhizobium sp. M4B.F.Ca.ET.058.02.1.1]
MRLTNVHGLSLPLAVWLLHDEYDYIDEPNYISATSLLKSTRQLVLSRRVNHEEREVDISAFLASSMGTAIHDSIEKAWTKSGRWAMKKLGYPDHIAENICVNPSEEQLLANTALIPVWMEQRAFRDITVNGVTYKIGGKFDLVLQGRLFDAKSTSVFAYLLGRKDQDYALQGGIYRWLNPELITDEHIFIQFIFTDWQKARARGDADYPQTKAIEYPVLMPSLEETERFIRNKLTEIQKYANSPDEEIPYCTDKELWRGETVYKYYSDPSKTSGRSTKNFDDKSEAHAFMASKGGKGIVVAVAGEVKACEWCPAFNACKQKDQYFVS